MPTTIEERAFQPFSVIHAGILLFFVVATALLIRGGRRSDAESRRRTERTLGWAMLGVWAVSNVWWLMPPRFDAARSLPLQVCDVTALLAGLVLLSPRPWMNVLLYFWGIGMSLQAIITPDLIQGPNDIWFWMFWISHAGTIGIAIYVVAVRGYRPSWRDYRFALVAGFVYLVVVFTVDVLFGFNYGYVGDSKPGQPSVIDFLGPWPGRVGLVAILVSLAMAILMLPWHVVRRRSE
ncbi:MAG TPA: TIGR02206 family membrane protein [Gemmatimonadaceae bacterium]|nr:TIGR02206 family membrane protein [Gemmatimonadaceae bacterium]